MRERYVLGELLGRGGMSVVYQARDQQTGAAVAVKVVRASAERVDRSERELLAVARLDSPHVCAITDSGVLPTGESYLVMPLLHGKTLQEVLEETPLLPPSRALAIVDQVLAALEVAHAAGVVHRDLKPANVFLIDEPEPDFVVVLDFGIARLVGGEDGSRTATGRAVGTAQYMAPEQARGQRDQDARVDVWAAGVLLYELTAGVRPFDAGSWARTLESVLFDPFVPPRVRRPDVPPSIEAVIVRALQRDRDARFADASEMRRELALASERASLPPASPRETLPDGVTDESPSGAGTPPTSDD